MSAQNENLMQVKVDFVFANLFGKKNHEKVLMCLLNSILNGKPHINSITLAPTEYRKVFPDGKSARLDIVAITDDETRINIEMQCWNNGNIADRASFYQSKLRDKVIKEGMTYSNIPNIISIWICDDNVTHRKGCVHEIVNMYKANNIDEVEVASDKFRQFIIELTKLETGSHMFLNDMFMVWMQFIKDPNSIPDEFLNIPEVKEAMDELRYMSADEETRSIYEARIKEINDMNSALATKFDEGAKYQALETAKNLIKIGLSIEQISQATGLSIDEISHLA